MIFSLLDTPAYGGAEEYLLTVLFHLKKKGNEVLLATNNAQVREKCKNKITVVHLPYRLDAIGNWKGLVKYFFALPGAILWLVNTILQFRQPVICLFPGYSDRLSFSPIVKWLGCKLIWLEYGPLEPTFARNHGFPKLLYTLGRPFPDKVVTISEWTKKSLVHVGKIPNEKILIIYPGVKKNESKRREEKGDRFSILTVARLATEKEIDLLLTAWSKVNRANAQLVIVGDGPERKHLEKLVTDLEITNSVTFTGFVSSEQKRNFLSNADLFVFPSAWDLEGFGMTTIEAMSAGLPVITSGFGPQSEIVKESLNGWYFTAHDSGDLAKKINTALHSNLRIQFGEAGRKICDEKFSEDRMLSAWNAFISSL